MITVDLYHGNLLDVPADVLVLSGNPSLHLTGGVGADLVTRYPDGMQARLHTMVAGRPQRIAQRGEVFVDKSDEFDYTAIIHAVAVNAFYESDAKVIEDIVLKCLDHCHSLGAETVAMSCLATGFGNLTLDAFCRGFKAVVTSGKTAFCGRVVLAQIERYRYDELVERCMALDICGDSSGG